MFTGGGGRGRRAGVMEKVLTRCIVWQVESSSSTELRGPTRYFSANIYASF